MNLSLTEEQNLIRSSAEKYFSEKFSFEKRQKYLQLKNNKKELLKNSKEFGWLALPFKSKYGGLDGDITDVMTLIEVFGGALSLDPYIFTLLLPGLVIEEFCSEEKKQIYLNKILEGSESFSFCFAEPHQRFNFLNIKSDIIIKNEKYILNGKKKLVIGADKSDHIIIPVKDNSDNILLFLANNKNDVFSKIYKTIDDYHAADYEFNDLELEQTNLLCSLPYSEYAKKIEYIMDYITLAGCSDALGVIEKMYSLTIDYIKNREQFGKKIASFQIIQHRMVDMYIKKEEMRSLNYMGQLSFNKQTKDNDRKKNVSLNKIFLASHAKNIAQDCIQLHGGMGVANEMQIGHCFKRLTAMCSLFGNLDFHYQRYSENDLI